MRPILQQNTYVLYNYGAIQEWGHLGWGGQRGADRAIAQLAAASPQFTTEIYNSVQKHVVRNWDGPDAKAFAGIYKSNWVCNVG